MKSFDGHKYCWIGSANFGVRMSSKTNFDACLIFKNFTQQHFTDSLETNVFEVDPRMCSVASVFTVQWH